MHVRVPERTHLWPYVGVNHRAYGSGVTLSFTIASPTWTKVGESVIMHAAHLRPFGLFAADYFFSLKFVFVCCSVKIAL